ncbi:MAG: hypothetical protein WKF75_13720 [Singulisphaera sp.]
MPRDGRLAEARTNGKLPVGPAFRPARLPAERTLAMDTILRVAMVNILNDRSRWGERRPLLARVAVHGSIPINGQTTPARKGRWNKIGNGTSSHPSVQARPIRGRPSMGRPTRANRPSIIIREP